MTDPLLDVRVGQVQSQKWELTSAHVCVQTRKQNEMPANYTGNPAQVGQGQEPVIACPVGTDAPNAASVNTPLQTLADFVAFLQTYAATAGTQQPNTDTLEVDGNPALRTAKTLAGGARTCLWETIVTVGASEYTARIYLTAAGAMELVHNCFWDATNSLWKADPTNTEQTFFKAVVARPGGPAIFTAANNANGWADSAWAVVIQLADINESGGAGGLAITDGVLALVGTTTSAGGSNPPVATAMANAVCAKNTCKAWGVVSCGFLRHPDADRRLQRRVAADPRQPREGLLRQRHLGSSHHVRGADTEHGYSVDFGVVDTAPPDVLHVPCVYDKTAGYFDIVLRHPGQAAFDDPGTLTLGVDFQVFGRQDT